jgi:hypothetical protein
MRRSIGLSIIAVGLLTAACLAGRTHDARLYSNAQRVRAGMTADEAVKLLGSPSWRDNCGAKMGSTDCVFELGYRSSFAPLLPSYIVVRLDRRSRVVTVDTLTSP